MNRLWLLPLILLLNACSILTPSQPADHLQMTGSAGDQWQLSGRVAIRQEQRADSASIDWQQNHADYLIELSGPLGQGGARIEGTPGAVTLQLSGDDTLYRGTTPEAVMQQALGWYLPVSQAHYWIQGRPDPAYPATPLSDGVGFSQLGWQIELRRTTSAAPDLVLPELIEFRYGTLRLRLLIHQWQLPEARLQPVAN